MVSSVVQFDTPALVPAEPSANTTQVLLDRVRETPNGALFSLPVDGGWKDVTSTEFLEQVIALAKGFISQGIKPGDRVGLMCKTRYEWTLIDFAMWFAGAALVPIYETSASSQIQWILEDSEAVALIVETPEHLKRFEEIRSDAPYVQSVWQIDAGDLDALVISGTKISDEEVEERRSSLHGSDLATLIYTSGSTGKPKGCVLTHSNFLELSRNARAAVPEVVNAQASTLLFITTAHIFARFISILAIEGGVKVGHQGDTTQLLPAMQSFKPSFLLAVPRVFEKVYNSAEQKAEAGGKGNIFRAAAKTAIEYSKAEMAGHIPLGLKLKFAVMDKLVLSKLRTALGGRCTYAISGSAPLGDRLGHFYHALGLVVLEGYGLTETTAPISINLPSKFVIGTVGPALPGCSVRIGEDGEIEAAGINVFKEYWKNPQATADTFHDGWFKTGDIGEIDKDGYITITGRKKEILVTAGGKNVAPAYLEDPIRANPVISQVVAVGDAKPFISALITLDSEMLPMWLTNNKMDPSMSIAEAAKNPAIIAEVQAAVDRANARVSRAESIRKFVILPIQFTEESGHLTPKMSIKRNVIVKDFAGEIEGMYAGASGAVD
ncbi:long-chain fatty acid--CoA ligase [uncultured Aurantimicrobium sp.]|uniref:AMP-dependent synthetase/ligase n=1 Tax=uncultured Aurantimicrobium sp. TaxID=1705357 RepID=UPI0026347907|nr:long-chain fatty acid--CoA ligase [uncultured Aurantimicrobium sp.]